jgi:hypothetical protein
MTPAATSEGAGPSAAAVSARPRVIYVMGASKSGSTIVGVTLGNCSDMFLAGELETWLVNSGTPALGGLERTRFWNGVREDVEGASELFGDQSQRSLERASSLLRLDMWSLRRRLRAPFRRITQDLYQAISRRSGARYVIDTSHLPLRAFELQALGGIDLYLIFLVRDRESIVASHARHLKRHEARERRRLFVTSNVNLFATYLLSTVVFARQPSERRMLLHYEDFVENPEAVLGDILRRVGSEATIPDLSSLSTGIPLRGNRLLGSPTVALKREVPAAHRSSRLTRILQLPWELVLSRLQPVAGAGGARGAAPADGTA